MADFNSAEYAWKDIEIAMLGRVLARVMEIEYTTDVEKKHIYGRGKKPIGIQTGNEKCSGQITIGQSELEAMVADVQSSTVGGKVTDVVLTINIAYIQDGQIVRDRVEGVGFTQIKKGMKQGDTDMEVKMPFMALDIKYNV